ncbi:pyridoxamine 5'-phosphate oxidase family protein [Catenulispora subtropica]|uniref:Pyridoxamine 5'-phosphate oxidase family protein n=1 Tax=Catenulispora subtropica TaxID=450798 RepID=A0ABN2RL73_9ACTN
MSELKPLRVKNLSLPEYGLEALDWEDVEQAVAAAVAGPGRSWFLTTLNPDGAPHTTGFGHAWLDGAVYFTTGPAIRKTRNLEADPRCTVAAPIDGYDVTFDGEAHRVTDAAVIERIAAVYAGVGWPAVAEGDVISAPFSAPSAGPGPWQVFRVDVLAAVALKSEEPYGATKWWFG